MQSSHSQIGTNINSNSQRAKNLNFHSQRGTNLNSGGSNQNFQSHWGIRQNYYSQGGSNQNNEPPWSHHSQFSRWYTWYKYPQSFEDAYRGFTCAYSASWQYALNQKRISRITAKINEWEIVFVHHADVETGNLNVTWINTPVQLNVTDISKFPVTEPDVSFPMLNLNFKSIEEIAAVSNLNKSNTYFYRLYKLFSIIQQKLTNKMQSATSHF